MKASSISTAFRSTQQAFLGLMMCVAVYAESAPSTFQWEGGIPTGVPGEERWSTISGATSAIYVPNTSTRKAASYTKFRVIMDSVTSSEVARPINTTPVIVVQPTTQATSGEETISVAVLGAQSTPVSIQWYVYEFPDLALAPEPIPGATGPSLTITHGNGYDYAAEVSNSFGTVFSSVVSD